MHFLCETPAHRLRRPSRPGVRLDRLRNRPRDHGAPGGGRFRRFGNPQAPPDGPMRTLESRAEDASGCASESSRAIAPPLRRRTTSDYARGECSVSRQEGLPGGRGRRARRAAPRSRTSAVDVRDVRPIRSNLEIVVERLPLGASPSPWSVSLRATAESARVRSRRSSERTRAPATRSDRSPPTPSSLPRRHLPVEQVDASGRRGDVPAWDRSARRARARRPPPPRWTPHGGTLGGRKRGAPPSSAGAAPGRVQPHPASFSCTEPKSRAPRAAVANISGREVECGPESLEGQPSIAWTTPGRRWSSRSRTCREVSVQPPPSPCPRARAGAPAVPRGTGLVFAEEVAIEDETGLEEPRPRRNARSSLPVRSCCSSSKESHRHAEANGVLVLSTYVHRIRPQRPTRLPRRSLRRSAPTVRRRG